MQYFDLPQAEQAAVFGAGEHMYLPQTLQQRFNCNYFTDGLGLDARLFFRFHRGGILT